MSAGAATSQLMTVRGLIEANDLGRTLIHEHLNIDLRPILIEHGYSLTSQGLFDCRSAAEARWNPGSHPENYDLTDEDLVAEEVALVQQHGVNCVVDATPVDLGRSPLALVRLSERLDLHVVMGAGWYLEATHEPLIRGWSVNRLRERLIAEFVDGVGDTGVRPGIIGEIGTNAPVTASELRVVDAAAQAGSQTGLAVSIHLHPWGAEGNKVLDVALSAGVQPQRVLLNHLSTAVTDVTYVRALLDRGVNVAFDLFGFDHSLLGEGRSAPSDWDVAHFVAELVRLGYINQLFISQDVGVRSRLHRYGGWGYDHLLVHVVPLLLRCGLTTSDVDCLLVENPRRLVALATPEIALV